MLSKGRLLFNGLLDPVDLDLQLAYLFDKQFQQPEATVESATVVTSQGITTDLR